jgi:hypothetical protein
MDKEWPDEDYFNDEPEESEFEEWRKTDDARRYRELDR